MWKLIFNAQSEPVAPVWATKHTMYADCTDWKIKVKDSAWCVCTLWEWWGGWISWDIWSTWADWDCTITSCTTLEAKEYNFDTFTLKAPLFFCWPWIPVIKANHLCFCWNIQLGASPDQIWNITCYYNVAWCVRNISNKYPTPVICLTRWVWTCYCGYGWEAWQPWQGWTCGGWAWWQWANCAWWGWGWGWSGWGAWWNATTNCGWAWWTWWAWRWSWWNGWYWDLRWWAGWVWWCSSNCFSWSWWTWWPSKCCGWCWWRWWCMNLTSNFTVNCSYVIFSTWTWWQWWDWCYRWWMGWCWWVVTWTGIMYVCWDNSVRFSAWWCWWNSIWTSCGWTWWNGYYVDWITICWWADDTSCIDIEIWSWWKWWNSLSWRWWNGWDWWKFCCSVKVLPNNSYQFLDWWNGWDWWTWCRWGSGWDAWCFMFNCTARPWMVTHTYLIWWNGWDWTCWWWDGWCGWLCALLNNDWTWLCCLWYPGWKWWNAYSSLYWLVLSARCIDWYVNNATICWTGWCWWCWWDWWCPQREVWWPGWDWGNGWDWADVHIIYGDMTAYDYQCCVIDNECVNNKICIDWGPGWKWWRGRRSWYFQLSSSSSACTYMSWNWNDWLPWCTWRYCLIKVPTN